ncbi:MAG: PLDc N-terminal domain-containing protein [Candidatus Nanoarchaeia archaeon]
MIEVLLVPMFLVGMIVLLGMWILWIWSVVDCGHRHFESRDEKTAWILILCLLQFLGTIFYYLLVVLRQRKKHKKK